jgi:hypothetical protein
LTYTGCCWQVYSQPAFATIEDILLWAFPKLDKLAGREWIVRLVYRTLYVVMTTVVACALPFFGESALLLEKNPQRTIVFGGIVFEAVVVSVAHQNNAAALWN